MSERIVSLAARAAAILGPQSAAAKAIAEMKWRQARGKDVTIWLATENWIVGPKRDDPADPDHA